MSPGAVLADVSRVAPPAGPASPHVVMMVRNPATHDARVRKEAFTLQRAGYRVTVLGVHVSDREEEIVDGVLFVRLRRVPTLYQLRRAAHGARQAKVREHYVAVDKRLVDRMVRQRERWLRTRDILAERGILAPSLRRPREAVAELVTEVPVATFPLDAVVSLPAAAERTSPAEDPHVLRKALRVATKVLRMVVKASREALYVALRSQYQLRRRLLVAGRVAARRGYRLGRLAVNAWWGGERVVVRALRPLEYHMSWIRNALPALVELRPTVVHVHDLNTAAAALAYRARHGAAVVYDAHELELHRNVARTPWDQRVAVVAEWMIVRLARAVITVSPPIADELRRRYGKRHVVSVMNTPSLRVLDVEVTSLRERLDIGEGRLLVYTGAAHSSRNLHTVVQALPLLDDDVHFAVLGPRHAQYDAELQGLAGWLGVTDRLHLLPPVSSHEVPRAVRDANVLLSPASPVCRSYELALPNKLFDAVFAGVPVLASRLPAMREFVEEHGLGAAFDERDPESLARAVRFVLEGGVGPVPAAALEALRTQYCWEAQEQVLLDVYASIVLAPEETP